MKVGILEDEFLIAEHLSNIIGDMGNDVSFICDNVASAKENILSHNVDFMILDITVTGKSTGVDLAKFINDNLNIPFLFITSNTNQKVLDMVKSTKPYAFLTKPFKNLDVEMALDLAIEKHNSIMVKNGDHKEYLFVKDKKNWLKVNYNQLIYIEASDNYSTLFLENDQLVITKNLKHFEEILPGSIFIRVNRSVIVNSKFISGFETKNLFLGEKKLVVTDNYKTNVLKLFKKDFNA